MTVQQRPEKTERKPHGRHGNPVGERAFQEKINK